MFQVSKLLGSKALVYQQKKSGLGRSTVLLVDKPDSWTCTCVQ